MVRQKYGNLILCALTALLIASAVFGIFIIEGKGVFVVRDDFNAQQIPFTVSLHDALGDGGLSGFDWSVDLGSSTLLSFGFYELGSAFFWLSMLFPSSLFPYVIGFIYILKYVTAAVAAYLYLAHFVKDERSAVFGALLYAFSGFQAVNLMFYHFHETVAFFPLLLLGLELLMDEEDGGFWIFALTVFLNCITNYFFFIQEVVFLVIYFLCRFLTRDKKLLIRRLTLCVAGGVLGVAMAGVIFIPSVLYILQGERASQIMGLSELWHDTRSLLEVIKGLLLPADPMNDNLAFDAENWKSMSCYLPLVGAIPALWHIRKKRDWLSWVLMICAAFSLSPLLSASFTMFTEYYTRWWYMPVLMMALASSFALEDEDKAPLKKWSAVYISALILFYLLVRYMPWSEEEDILYNRSRLIIYTSVSVCGALGVLFLAGGRRKARIELWIAAAAVFCALTTFMTLYFYRSDATRPDEYIKEFELAMELKGADDKFDDAYRLNLNNGNLYTMAAHKAGMASFISTRSTGIEEFEALFDYSSTNNGLDKGEIPGLTELLGGRYGIYSEERDEEPLVSFTRGDGGIYIYDEGGVCPMGLAVNRYIRKSDLMSIEVEKRAIALMEAAVVDDDVTLAEPAVKAIPGELNLAADIDYLVDMNSANSVRDFKRNGRGFSCKTAYPDDTYVYFSVPYDKGWSASEDGKPVEIINSGGMMLVRIGAGEHELAFEYTAPNFRLGLFASAAAWLLFGATAIVKTGKIRERK